MEKIIKETNAVIDSLLENAKLRDREKEKEKEEEEEK